MDKNEILKETRGVCFEDVIDVLKRSDHLDIINHPNIIKYPTQKILLVDIGGYVWVVPFVQQENKIFLKTIYKSRKATKNYLGE